MLTIRRMRRVFWLTKPRNRPLAGSARGSGQGRARRRRRARRTDHGGTEVTEVSLQEALIRRAGGPAQRAAILRKN